MVIALSYWFLRLRAGGYFVRFGRRCIGGRFCLLGRVRGRLGGSARQRRGKGLRDGWGNGGRAGKIRRQCDRRRLRDCWAGERCRGGRERPAVDAQEHNPKDITRDSNQDHQD